MTDVPDVELVDAVLAAVRQCNKDYVPGARNQFPYDVLAGRYPADVVLGMMDRLSEAEVIDYGVSLRTGWVCEYDPDLDARIEAFKRGEQYETDVTP